MVTYYVMKMTTICSPIIGECFDTMIVASSDEEWLQWPIEILVLETVLSHLKGIVIQLFANRIFLITKMLFRWTISLGARQFYDWFFKRCEICTKITVLGGFRSTKIRKIHFSLSFRWQILSTFVLDICFRELPYSSLPIEFFFIT